ncbi:hypothetical protein OESDEN_11492 [Oesophagostomum dentatum]|uniref:Uncharacterized protein n=1 Tax=Oesophagostomum dentatum TaxID=61180 RepID=A0A0B1SYZ1_OESDE|nr:hypothetical protein OESDEN_11492 [Oesophagostomum dentatum]
MEALLFLALITTCSGAGARIYREVREPQLFVQAATYPPRRILGVPYSPFRSRSRVFRNVQVPADDEPRLYRASGRFQKKVVAAAPIHDVSSVTVSKDLPPNQQNSFSYDEGTHHLNKMNEDNSILEEAAEFAKGLERTTVSVRNDQDVIYTTPMTTVDPLKVPAIIKPRVLLDEKKSPIKQPPPAFPQQPPMGRPQQNTFTSPAVPVTQTTPVVQGFGANGLVPTQTNLIKGPYPQPGPQLGQQQVAGTIPLTLQPPPNQQVLPGLVPPQLPPQIPPGIPQVVTPVLPSGLNPAVPQLGAVPQIPPGVQVPQFPQPHSQTASVQPQHLGPGSLPTQVPPQVISGQISHQQVPQLGLPTQAAPPPPAFAERIEVINGQAANSSLEQLGCGFDWISNTCKDVFAIGWCGQCHDFGNIFVHDCKCVRPLIALPPRPPQPARPVFFTMI